MGEGLGFLGRCACGVPFVRFRFRGKEKRPLGVKKEREWGWDGENSTGGGFVSGYYC